MRKSNISLLVIVLSVFAAFALFLSRQKPVQTGFIYSSGTITGDEIMASSKLPGRIKNVYVSRGSSVKINQILFSIDDKELIQKEQAEQAQISAEQSRLDEISKAIPSEIIRLKNESISFYSNYKMLLPLVKNAQADYRRFTRLLKGGSVSKREADRIESNYLSLKQKADSALSLYRSAYNAYIASKSKIIEIRMQKEKIEALKHQLNIILLEIGNSKIKSPVNGIIAGKFHYTGEVVATGMPVVSIINPEKLYLKMFAAEDQLRQLKLGQPARIYIGTKKPFTGKVSYIASQAEFTPKNVETKKQRVALVYEIHIALKNRGLLLKNGMIADATIKTDPSKKWTKS